MVHAREMASGLRVQVNWASPFRQGVFLPKFWLVLNKSFLCFHHPVSICVTNHWSTEIAAHCTLGYI
jgi:hypothetical protein